MASQKQRTPPQPPPTFTANPATIIQDTKFLIERARESQSQIKRNIQPNTATFNNVILPLAHIDNALASKSHILVFYRAVSTNPELRNASIEARNLLDCYNVETTMDDGLFALVDAVFHKDEELEPESYRLLKKLYMGYVRHGLGLSAGYPRDRFREIQSRLSWIKAEFQRNLVEANSAGIWFTVEELDGLPEDFLSGLMRGKLGEVNEDKVRVTFNDPDLFKTLSYARNSNTRRRIYIANENKCTQNVSLFREAVLLRDEAARLLGYPSHAALQIEDKMAKCPETVNAFLGDLQTRLSENGQREVEKLKRLKRADLESRGESFDGRYFLWDHQYYHRMMLEKQYSVHQQKIAEYFPFLSTIAGMLKVCETLFGLFFSELSKSEITKLTGPGDAPVWHEDVQVFSVWNSDEDGGFVGYLYMDLFLREGKYANAANFNLIPGFIQESGTRQYPATALVCNFSKPNSEAPCLMKHDELVTLFHELGHAIHDLVSKTTYSHFHGTETEVDFGEAPSQMLENWCWTPSVLRLLSRHYSYLSSEYFAYWKERVDREPQPQEQMPDTMIESILRAKHVNGALFHLRQLHFAIFDMVVHEPDDHNAIKELDISAKYNNLLARILPMDGPEGGGWGYGQTRFQHLLGEYDAGYYSYLFSKVYATDMFYTVFKPDPMNYREGRRYRYTVLEKGGSLDGVKILTDLLGREPQKDAFYQELCQN
ncbi:putative thimet oligopeptidase [Aspergillus nomiae NRRL 13137]|uniref:Putative thimet oligopeptidase n=1 Tax=Aspergillus nomiae NRRL (strain ATCC 15546 / NRRL 13137 / CBS 260.88 / M93) TaxID=1509407 RepID=A0A0L1JIW3_ASPN3|nr:putative thimet oligopeptidase [Aspergillus nomiae NRRL 13137]KNG91709.1 putative thimet oligopeptidase [Aspergillus nomiae NRRL 13137]